MSEVNNNNNSYSPIGTGSAIPTLPTQYQVPINSLFTSVFGIANRFIKHYDVPPDNRQTPEGPFTIGEVDTNINKSTITSYLGTPVHFWMKFKGSDYNYRVKGNIETKTMAEYTLPFTSIATFDQDKRITETPMSGQTEGSVIEEYGMESFKIDIQGFIIKNDVEGTIEEQVEKLTRWKNLSNAIIVTGELFTWLGIEKIAIINIKFLPNRNINAESVLPFEITARSSKDINLLGE